MKTNRSKKTTRTKFRHKVIFTVFRPVIWLVLRVLFGFRYKKYKLPKGPAIILFNHATNLDALMVCLSIKGPVYIVATDDIFSIPIISPLIKYLIAPISKSKSIRDIKTIKECITTIKEGGKVSLSPEGNRTYSGELCHINPAVVKLVKLLKVPLVLYGITGGFGVHPRFSARLRRGRTFGQVTDVIMPEQFLDYSNQELLDKIISGLTLDEFSPSLKYKSKRKAEYLESLFYICPVCKRFSTLHSIRNELYCEHCGLIVEYTEDRTFITEDMRFHFKTVREWYKYQNNYILSYEIKDTDGEMFFDENVILKDVIKDKVKKTILIGRLSISQHKIIVKNDEITKEFLMDEIYSIALLGNNKVNFYIDDKIYQLKSNKAFNGLKYMHFYHIVRMKKQGVKDGFLGI